MKNKTLIFLANISFILLVSLLSFFWNNEELAGYFQDIYVKDRKYQKFLENRMKNDQATENLQTNATEANESFSKIEPYPLIWGNVDKIIDGDSLIISGKEIRLFGIDAPEYNSPKFLDAKNLLYKITKGKKIICEKITIDSYKRIIARCYINYEIEKFSQKNEIFIPLIENDISNILLQTKFIKEYCRYSDNYYKNCYR